VAHYRKKPVVIEARQYTGPNGNWYEIATWANATLAKVGMVIYTQEGPKLAQEGDWIIKGVKGEFYPCKPDIFEETYELA
jgi:hypothetical protein